MAKVKVVEFVELKRNKLSTYRARFNTLKTDFLHYKWIVDMNLEQKNTAPVRRRLAKVSKLLFEIEAEFFKDAALMKQNVGGKKNGK